MLHFVTALTIFISAYLLFYIQPLLAKSLLPVMGGSAVVWLAGMLFFQSGLLLGYGYAYALTKVFSERKQAIIHLTLILLSFYFIPIKLYSELDATATWQPLAVLKLYATHILLPFTLLSATSPLFQHWYCRLRKTTFPYYFYSISNAGSLIGLIGYPLLLEPILGIQAQALLWSCLYGLYALVALMCLLQVFRANLTPILENNHQPLQKFLLVKWLVLAFLGCALFLAVTQFLAQNIINLPLMWVLPLALYLISFIVTFAKPKGYDRSFWTASFLIWLIALLWLMFQQKLGGINVIVVLLALEYSGCMVCHGELIRLKPEVEKLTLFYFYIALGGVLAGIFVNLLAPLIFIRWWDFYLPLIGINLLVLGLYVKGTKRTQTKEPFAWTIFSMAALSLTSFYLYQDVFVAKKHIVAQFRNPYGFIKVIENKDVTNPYRALMHGTIMHGLEFLSVKKQSLPTTYYGIHSGIGRAIAFQRQIDHRPLRIGVVGLGAGTLAAFGEKGDSVDFYEIDKDIIDIAHQHFNFLKNSEANIQIFLGDARLELAKSPNTYDLLVIDAFNGDVIPFHLVTLEAMQLYFSKLKSNGIIAFNTTNTYLNFQPVIAGLAKEIGCNYTWISNNQALTEMIFPATWGLVSCSPHLAPWLRDQHMTNPKEARAPVSWTDDKNSILPLLKLS